MHLIPQRTILIKLATFITMAVAGISGANAALSIPVINGGLITAVVASAAPDQPTSNANRGDTPIATVTMRNDAASGANNKGTTVPPAVRDERSAAGTSLGKASVSTVPEPSTGAMLLLGLALICFASRHQHRNEKFSD